MVPAVLDSGLVSAGGAGRSVSVEGGLAEGARVARQPRSWLSQPLDAAPPRRDDEVVSAQYGADWVPRPGSELAGYGR